MNLRAGITGQTTGAVVSLQGKISGRIAGLQEDGLLRPQFLTLWFLGAVYPLLVVPNRAPHSVLGIHVLPDYVYFPRYLVLAVLAALALALLIGARPRLRHPALVPLGAFVLLGLAATFLAAYPATAWLGSPLRWTGFSTYLFSIILFLLAMATLDEPQTGAILGGMAACAALVGLLALLQSLGLNLVPHAPYQGSLVAYGAMAKPLYLGMYSAFMLPASLMLYLRRPHPLRLACAVLAWTGVLLSLTPGSWLAGLLAVALAAGYGLRRQELRRPLLFALMALALATAALCLVHGGALLQEAASLASPFGHGLRAGIAAAWAGSDLPFVWGRCWQIFTLAWRSGVGPDHLIYFRILTPHHGLVMDKAENLFLEIGVTMGAFVLLTYLAFLCLFIRRPSGRQQYLLLAMIAVYLAHGMFSGEDVVLMPLFWLVLGMALAPENRAAAAAAEVAADAAVVTAAGVPEAAAEASEHEPAAGAAP